MTDNIRRCEGENAHSLCAKREQCLRYQLHRADDNDLRPRIPQSCDLGWGKVYHRDISQGCNYFINNKQ